MAETPAVPTRDSAVSLREVTKETVRKICRLKTTERQELFVAPNAVSFAEAYFEPKAWIRAIYADETPVGFLMLYDDGETPEYFLWRLMFDTKYQRMGFGTQALDLLLAYLKTRPNATQLVTSYGPEEDGPGDFYHKYGFVDTGEVDDEENVTILDLTGR